MVRNQQSMRLRQNAQNSKKEHKKEVIKKQKQPPVKSEKNNSSGLLYFGGETAFKTLLSARFSAAIWSHISDCDETYNYWEPIHYLVFGKGLQTWEYSPEFALRSYTYLLFHATPIYIYHKILQPNPLLMFYLVRCLLGLVCAFSEVYFYKAVCREFGVHIGRICLSFQLFSAGMFVASTALLPSTFAMYTFTASCAAWWQQRYALAIFFTALGSILGWPFAALLGLPIAFDMIFRKKLIKEFILWCLISGSTIAIPMVLIDSYYYGKFVVAPFNIIKYNVFSSKGPNLYGEEPFSYYLINGFLNFNLIWVLALLCPLGLFCSYLFIPAKNKSCLCFPYWLSLSPFYLWLAVFMLQPHKEERFLFPIYPMICLCGAITLDVIQKLFFRILNVFRTLHYQTHYLDYTMFIMIGVVSLTGALGIARIFALYKNYHAPLDLFMELNRFPVENKLPDNLQVNVCLGKDWHRYPSSFFLPDTNWNIRFIKSEFKGMLPAPYLSGENSTRLIPEYFNDQNMEVESLYFNVNKCHFLLDLDLGVETEIEPIYSNQKTKWKLLKNYTFLNAPKSNRWFRAFYIPYFTEKSIVFGNFTLLQSVRFKLKI